MRILILIIAAIASLAAASYDAARERPLGPGFWAAIILSLTLVYVFIFI
ncbi:MAG: hypothetical protein ACRD98_00305 [Nitrososphaera sp.]